MATAGAVVLVLLIGSRGVLSQSFPLVGQLPSTAGGVSEWWHTWWSGAGIGTLGRSSFSPPGLLLMGLLGLLTLGSTNVAVHLLVLGPLLIGPLGVYVGARRLGSDRGRLAATVLYAALPVPYNALSQGHWAGLVAYAAAPWLVSGLCDLGGEAPYTFVPWDAAWPRFLALGLGLAAAASLAPALLLVVPALGAAFFLASLLVGGAGGGGRLLWASLVVAGVAFVALAPWSFSALRSWSGILGPPSVPVHPLGLSQVLHLQTGPYGGGALGWALVVAAALSMFIGRSWRLVWAARMWVVALVCMTVAFAGSRGWLPVPALELVLAPAGAALVFAVALGATSVEVDLSGYRFGWHQFAPPFGALAALAATLPLLAWVGSGQWDLPAAGAEQAYAFPAASPSGDYRVLWVGRPGSLPLAAQGSSEGVSFAASADGLPLAGQLWTPATSSQSTTVGRDLGWAENNETTGLGHLLAPTAVRFIVVPVQGNATARTVDALSRQVDLVPVGLDPSYRVFVNSAWLPVFSVLTGTGATQLAAAAAGVTPWAAAYELQKLDLRPARALATGTAGAGTFSVPVAPAAKVLYASVPPGSWRARADGHALVGRSVAGAATSWVLPTGSDAVAIAPSSSGAQHFADVVTLVLWAVGLSLARTRRRKTVGEFIMANLEVGSPGADVLEIDWSAVLDGQNVG